MQDCCTENMYVQSLSHVADTTVYHCLVQNLGENSSNQIFLLITLSSSVFFSLFFQLLKENLQTLGTEIERLIKHQHELEQRTKKA